MSRPRQTIITYGPDGKVATVEHRVVLIGTENFGEGPKPVERDHRDSVAGNQISPTTITAAKALLDAFEIDLAAERQRIATAAQAEADRVAALALQAQADADKRQIDAAE